MSSSVPDWTSRGTVHAGSRCRPAPSISVIIPVHNRWSTLGECLGSLRVQRDIVPCEVIVVDDGSTEPASDAFIAEHVGTHVRILRQPHLGISMARNHGISVATGEILLCVDSDCRLDACCLRELAIAAIQHPQDMAFQLHIAGDCSYLVGKAEHMWQSANQAVFQQADGQIRWLNTSGFAVRKASVAPSGHLFDRRAKRGEDNLLLVRLVKSGSMPRFVPNAIVTHCPRLRPLGYILKAFKTAVMATKAMSLMTSEGVNTRASRPERWSIMRLLWAQSCQLPSGKAALMLIGARYGMKSVGRAVSLVLRRMTKTVIPGDTMNTPIRASRDRGCESRTEKE
ncbi:MAG: glycosyltransferase [Phycisphaerales bacterium]